MNEEAQYIYNTRQFARLMLVAPEAIRNQLYRHGSYYGIIPKRLVNGRLAWPNKGYFWDERNNQVGFDSQKGDYE
jgi:hypothetical protein